MLTELAADIDVSQLMICLAVPGEGMTAAVRGLFERPRRGIYRLAVAAGHSERTGSKLPADKPSALRKERNDGSERIKVGKKAPL